jgi:hypothetical protein
VQTDDAARAAILSDLRRRAVEAYGEERVAELPMRNMLQAAADALWLVSREPLAPDNDEP